jgi:hypothetical protein
VGLLPPLPLPGDVAAEATAAAAAAVAAAAAGGLAVAGGEILELLAARVPAAP